MNVKNKRILSYLTEQTGKDERENPRWEWMSKTSLCSLTPQVE